MSSSKDTVLLIEETSNGRESQKTAINILCLDITPYSQLTQFLLCSAFVFVCYLAYGYFLELIFSRPEVKPVSLYITLVQFIITMFLSYVESLIRNPIKRKWVFLYIFFLLPIRIPYLIINLRLASIFQL